MSSVSPPAERGCPQSVSIADCFYYHHFYSRLASRSLVRLTSPKTPLATVLSLKVA